MFYNYIILCNMHTLPFQEHYNFDLQWPAVPLLPLSGVIFDHYDRIPFVIPVTAEQNVFFHDRRLLSMPETPSQRRSRPNGKSWLHLIQIL